MDIALQHISNPVLEKMRRHVTQEETYHLIEQFRKEVPGIHLRTTLMVGHPGETEADFEELKEFPVSYTHLFRFAITESYTCMKFITGILTQDHTRFKELVSIAQTREISFYSQALCFVIKVSF